MKEADALCRRLDQLRGEIDADSAALRAHWRSSPFASRWLLGALAGAGGLLFSARSAALLRRAGIKPLLMVAALKIVERVILRRRR